MKLKNIIIMIMAVFFVTSISKVSAHTITNYYGINMTIDEYMTLMNLGFSEDEIHYMDEETFELNKDADATLLTREIKYLKTVYPTYGNSYTVEVSEEEYFNEANNMIMNPVVTQYKTIVSTISQNGSKYRYKVSETWTSMPSNRSYDIIGIGFSDYIYINSNVYFTYYYTVSSGNTSTSSSYANMKSTANGGAVAYHLPTGSIVGLGATLYYDVSKNTSNTITYLTMCGDYAHSTTTISPSNIGDYNITSGGISLGATLIGKFDATPCATGTAYVNW